MKNRLSWAIAIVLFLTIASVSCEKYSGNNDSITGSWQCREESSNGGYRQYTVNINRTDFDTTLYLALNFHSLGFDTETYFQLHDTVATILPIGDGNFSITGKGYVRKNHSSIDWEYSVSGLNVNDNNVWASFFRK